VVDGLFGSGLTRPVEGIYSEVIRHINRSGAEVIAVDIPSGLFGEDNRENDLLSVIQADYTLTFQFPFLSFFFSENEKYTGEWVVLDIGLHPEIIGKLETKYAVLTRERIAGLLPGRPRFAHKGVFGHALAVAGSSGMMGAALLTGEAALRSGAGLVTLHVPVSGFRVVQTAFPEGIVSIDRDADVFSELPDMEKYAAVAVGPGLGNHEKSLEGLQQLLKNVSVPLVIDADALNMIAAHRELLSYLPEGSVLTPHPLEFDRLAGTSPDAWSRHLAQIGFSVKYQVTVVLKGAYTSVTFPDGSCVFNSTGNPGMATGGSGDVLTGIILSLLAQQLSPENAAMAGVYLHGLAGDKAAEKYGEESMIAGDIIRCLGDAFRMVKAIPFLHEGRRGGIFQ
jgi:ADP-dependent NAD(P)H-hydrate dehydratase / NAD(P)H-hydrate epimerase